jgi:predicted Fe-Mo cluster-binding NifX family protein
MAETHKIAIPSSGAGGLDAQRSAHFGHADCFTVVDVVDGEIAGVSVIVNPPHEQGGCGRTVAMLAAGGVDTAIVVGMGGGPLAAMTASGLTPLFDGETTTPRSAIEAFLAGNRTDFRADNTCRGH